MTFILAVTESHVPPEVIGAPVSQVVAVEADLVIAFSHCGLVPGYDAIICQERWDHVDGVGPREGMNWWGEWSGAVVLPELELADAMGDCAVARPWNGKEIVELVLDGLRIVLTVSGLLVRPVCKNDGNSDAWWISGGTIFNERLWGVFGRTPFGNDIPRDGEDIVERGWRIGPAWREFGSRCGDRVSRAVKFEKRLCSCAEFPTTVLDEFESVSGWVLCVCVPLLRTLG